MSEYSKFLILTF